MSNTIVDMPKVCQMLDSGWVVELMKLEELPTYCAIARTDNLDQWLRAVEPLREIIRKNFDDIADHIIEMEYSDVGELSTDDFTPEQALTRLAYKVHGEIIDSDPPPVKPPVVPGKPPPVS